MSQNLLAFVYSHFTLVQVPRFANLVDTLSLSELDVSYQLDKLFTQYKVKALQEVVCTLPRYLPV